MTTAAGPLQRVVEAIVAGAATRADIAGRAGLDRDVVDAVIDHLLRTGRLGAEQIGGACPDTGCGSCPSGRSDGAAGCGSSGPLTARGPVALTLGRRGRIDVRP